MTKKNTDFIIAHDATKGPNAYALECRHCGTLQQVMPADGKLNLDMWLAMAKEFSRQHKNCKVKP